MVLHLLDYARNENNNFGFDLCLMCEAKLLFLNHFLFGHSEKIIACGRCLVSFYRYLTIE